MSETGKHIARKHQPHVRDREQAALRLRRAGATYDQIAHQLGFANRGSAFKAIARAIRTIVVEDATALVTLELDRLDQLHATYWPRALAGDLGAAERVLRVHDRRARLLGLTERPIHLNLTQLVAEITRRHQLTADESRELAADLQRYLDRQRSGLD